MWLEIVRPAFAPGAVVRVSRVHAAVGDRLAIGDPFVDLHVDLGGGEWLDCPAVSTCRITMRETAWVQSVDALPDQELAEEALLGRLSTESEATAGPIARPARITVATVVDESDWWGG